jgi:hypothetical protein
MGGYYTRGSQDAAEFWGCVGSVLVYLAITAAVGGVWAYFGLMVLLWIAGLYLVVGTVLVVVSGLWNGFSNDWWEYPLFVLIWPAVVWIGRKG